MDQSSHRTPTSFASCLSASACSFRACASPHTVDPYRHLSASKATPSGNAHAVAWLNAIPLPIASSDRSQHGLVTLPIRERLHALVSPSLKQPRLGQSAGLSGLMVCLQVPYASLLPERACALNTPRDRQRSYPSRWAGSSKKGDRGAPARGSTLQGRRRGWVVTLHAVQVPAGPDQQTAVGDGGGREHSALRQRVLAQ